MPTSKRRSRGDGSIYWDEKRQRFIAAATVGYTPAGKRITRKGSGKTITEAKQKLKEVLRDYEDGLAIASHNLTVADAIRDWLTYGLNGRSEATRTNYTTLAEIHIVGEIGARKLRDLSAQDVDRWLVNRAKTLSPDPRTRLVSMYSLRNDLGGCEWAWSFIRSR